MVMKTLEEWEEKFRKEGTYSIIAGGVLFLFWFIGTFLAWTIPDVKKEERIYASFVVFMFFCLSGAASLGIGVDTIKNAKTEAKKQWDKEQQENAEKE